MLQIFLIGGLTLLAGALSLGAARKQPSVKSARVLRWVGYVAVVCGLVMLAIPLVILVCMILSF